MTTTTHSRNRATFDGARILVAEDDESFRGFVSQALDWAGFQVETCTNGGQVLSTLARQATDDEGLPALLITDVQMPEMDGITLLQAVRSTWPDLPVVLMTCHGDHEVLRAALKHGCHGYIDKPFVVSQLEEVVVKTLRDHARLEARVKERRSPSKRLLEQGSGSRLRMGKFEILGEIARGAMGIVYKARQLDLDRIVALKIHRPWTGRDLTAHTFRREAQAMAQLHHPNIAVVHEIGTHEQTDYFTMEYISGATLAQRLDAAPLAPTEAVEVIASIAEGLVHAHELNVLHRDVKPSNIVFAEDGHPVLVDFGIATRKGERPTRAEEGYLEGTLCYMAPEYATTGTYDELCDLFSLGVVLYESIAGKQVLPYWEGKLPQELVHGGPRRLGQLLADTQPVPIERRVEVPPALAQVVRRATVHDRSERFPHLEAFAAALRAL